MHEYITEEQDDIISNYRGKEREAIYENGDIIKYIEIENEVGNRQMVPEWIFSPMLGWDKIPEKFIKKISDSNCMWDYFGKVIFDEFYADPEVGWRRQYFIMKSSGEWKFRIIPNIRIYEGYWHSFTPPKPMKRFSLFGGMKIYNKSEGNTLWTNEDKFVERFSKRQPLSKEKL
jgi:hypothetical protein